MRAAVRSLDRLLAALGLDAEAVGVSRQAARDFPVLVTPEWLRAMEHGNPADPLLRQVLPAAREEDSVPGYSVDPLQEYTGSASPGLIRKYRGRALLVLTGACAVHCRYCFRRHFPYQQGALTPARWREVLAELQADAELREVILSGGDPLLTGNGPLASLFEDLYRLPRLRWLRIHTRLPLVLPERVDNGLLELLANAPLPVAVVIHGNHPRELTPGARAAIARLRGAGVSLLNQSVLLRGVNDCTQTLAELSEALYESGVLPYYLHLLDPVAGAAHFAVDEDRARALHAAIRGQLPGYLVPRLVREVPGDVSKRWMS